MRAAIDEKCVLYEARLRKLERHLLAQADLTKLFREVVRAEQSRPVSVASNSSSGMITMHSAVNLTCTWEPEVKMYQVLESVEGKSRSVYPNQPIILVTVLIPC